MSLLPRGPAGERGARRRNGRGAVTRRLRTRRLAEFRGGGAETAWRSTGQRQDDGRGCIITTRGTADPALGRFITPDTIVQSPHDPQNLNRYAYCFNNPINYTDPSGHFSWNIKHTWRGIEKALGHNAYQSGAASWWKQEPRLCMGKRGNYCNSRRAPPMADQFDGSPTGEAVGGYSAYRAGGDILSGVAIGGVIGAVTATRWASGRFLRDAMGGSRLGYVFGGATRGAIMGMERSAASYAGGIGDGSVVRGAYRGAAIGGIAGGVLGYLE
ncbi:MAG: hypothetical protein IPQ26_10585 [Elusimicrobia bacterium]|nr:hypothetical protein [Elusimicrobiota bacterium]